MGIKASNTAEVQYDLFCILTINLYKIINFKVHFDNVKIPVENLLGSQSITV